MIKNQRQQKLLELMQSNEIMTVSDLMDKMSTSRMTICRDIDDLEKTGVVKKIHGGAVLIKRDSSQPTFQERITEFCEEKVKIGKEAAKLIKPGASAFFDAGTTPLAIIEHIPDNLEFTAITTGLMTAVALCKKINVNVIIIGGNIHKTSYSTINYFSVDMIKKFKADIAFISTKAFSFPEGTFEAQMPLIEIERAIVSVSKNVVLVADHSKFETESLCLSIPLNSINTIVTDKLTSPAIIDELTKKGIEVIIS